MNLTKFSPPCSHFGIIFEQEEGNWGIPLYQTWHIVNSITLYHITSHSIVSYHMVSYPIKLIIYLLPEEPIVPYYTHGYTHTQVIKRIIGSIGSSGTIGSVGTEEPIEPIVPDGTI